MKTSYIFLSLFLLSFISQAQNFDIYVSDAGNFNNPPWKIIRYDSSGANPITFINTNLGWPQDIVFLEDSNVVLISNLNTNRINRHNATTGAYMNVFATGISGPTRMKIGADTLLYVLQWSGNGRVLRYQLDGTFVGNFTSVGVPQSIGMDWDKHGNLYVSSYNGDNVRKFGPTGADSGLFVNSNLAGPTNIWFDDAGDLLVSDYDGTAVKRFDSSGTFQSNFLSGLSNSEGVAFLPNGNILIGNGANRSVKMFDNTGTYISDFISSGLGGLLIPNAVVVREKITVSVEEVSARSLDIINKLGDQFYITSDIIPKIDRIRIFTIAGQEVGNWSSGDTLIWDARSATEGTYILNVIWEDGQSSSEKVVVSH